MMSRKPPSSATLLTTPLMPAAALGPLTSGSDDEENDQRDGSERSPYADDEQRAANHLQDAACKQRRPGLRHAARGHHSCEEGYVGQVAQPGESEGAAHEQAREKTSVEGKSAGMGFSRDVIVTGTPRSAALMDIGF